MPHPGAFGLLLTLHVVLAVFIIGPLTLVGAAVPLLLRGGAGALPVMRLAARLVRVFAVATLLVALTGVGLVHQGSFGSVRSFGDDWLAASMVLWVVGAGSFLGLVAPGLSHAIAEIDAGGDPRRRITTITAGAALGSACWLIVVALMVIKPGG
ncbi:hypothetical protein [Frankia sp. AgKG'84/4]|uniref:hypothetical protein n=1 Tax=Frankia sp. AgKG'84/4 TaxID=573490 RepID=UPI00200D1BB6|nr:hypothetical protein [Frankia sp. AgKG'84/4]MCL9794821.1 hypothetical protein [Frankia sp. AgKG'84/4]